MRCMRVTFDGSRCVAQAVPPTRYCRQHRPEAPRDMPGVSGPDRTGSVAIEGPRPAVVTGDRPEEVRPAITLEGFVTIARAAGSKTLVLRVRDPAVTGVLPKTGEGFTIDLGGGTRVGIRLSGLDEALGSRTGRLHARAFAKRRFPSGRKIGSL